MVLKNIYNKFFQTASKLFKSFVYFFKKISFLKNKGQYQKNTATNDRVDTVNLDEQLVASLSHQRLPSLKQIKYLPHFLNPHEKIIINVSLVVIAICLLFIVYIFLKDKIADRPVKGGIYTEAVVGAPRKINPLYAAANETDEDISRLVFAGLLKLDQNQEIILDLAREWFTDETKTKYTFILKDNVKWPDEKIFDSEDVLFTFNAIKDKLYQSPLKSTWENIEINALDQFSIQFILAKPTPSFLENLTIGILPAHFWQDIEPENALLAELNLEPIGLGPYKFKSYTKDKQGRIKSYTLIKNENYHLTQPFIEQITLKFYPNFELAVDALKNKNADGLNFLPTNLKNILSPRNDLIFYYPTLPQYTAIFLNSKNNPLLKELAFKQALNFSIDKNKIVDEILNNEGHVIHSPLIPRIFGRETTVAQDIFNSDEAKKILADLDFVHKNIVLDNNTTNLENTASSTVTIEYDANGISKFLFKNDAEAVINLTIPNRPQSQAVGEMIQKYWQSIGIKTNIITVDPKNIEKNIIEPRNYEALLFGEILGRVPDLYNFWHSSQNESKGLNLTDFSNKELDTLLEKARESSKVDEKYEYYSSAAKIIENNLPAIFLYNPNYTYVLSNKIKGIILNHVVTSSDRLNNIASWYIKTKKTLNW